LADQTPDTGRDEPGNAAPLLTAQEAAALLAVNERTIRRAIASGDLPAVKLHGAFRIEPTVLESWRQRRSAVTQAASQARLPGDGPRLRSDLPRPITSLIGREQEAKTVGALIRQPGIRLVTLIGPGGVGKTRLALKVAADLSSDYPAGVWFVPLDSVAEPARVIDAITYDLGIREPVGGSRREALITALRDEAAVLVLDNFEQVVDAATDLHELMLACPSIKLLVTSRTRLRISGEHAYPVPSLALPAPDVFGSPAEADETPAVRLFADRAAQAEPSFALTAVTTPLVVDICRLLDGLPLAIELAAARVNVLSLPVLRDRLDQRLTLLTGGVRDAPARHRTLRDAVAWSYGLLNPEEQAVFRWLAVFAGGFTIDAAERVAGAGIPDQTSVIEVIGSLVDKSLLRRDDRPDHEYRFVMLGTIRAYALERLEAAGEAHAVRDRHAAWCVEFVEDFLGGWDYIPEDLWWLHPAEEEHDNVRAALAWLERTGDASRMLRLAIAMQSLWEVRNLHTEAVQWFQRGLAIARGSSPVIRLKTHSAIGRTLRRQGRYDEAREHFRAALTLARDNGYERAKAVALYALGGIEVNLERYDLALPLLEEAREQFEQLGDGVGACGAHYFLAILHFGQGDDAAAASHLEAALDARGTAGALFNLPVLLNALSLLRCEMGDLNAAADALEEGRAVWEKGRGANQEILAEWMVVAARLANARDQPERAARLLGAAEGLTDRLGMPLVVPPPTRYRQLVAMVQDRLGPVRFTNACRAGQTTPVMEIVAQGLTVAGETAPPSLLSARELEVLRLMTFGLRDREIADRLFISVRTVEGHVAHLISKLGVTSRPAAVSAAVAHGLIEPASQPGSR
jgi:non-specific serine/threonine protein kinase